VKILLVTHYFSPEIGAPQSRLGELSRFWAEAGENVTVLTGMPNHPTGVIPEAYRGRMRMEERSEGCRVLRSWVYATPNEGVVKKTVSHLSFMVSSVVLSGPRSGPVDVVVVSSPTFFSIFAAWFLARLRRARLVVEVRDLWPAIFVELGVLTNARAIGLLERLELWAYRVADVVVVVSEGFRENLIARGVPASKVHTIRNGVDLERFDASASSSAAARGRLGAGAHDTLVLYIGAHGISHGLGAVLEAAQLVEQDAIHVAFVGEGAEKAALATRCRELGLRNVTMLPGVPREEVPDLVAAADICLVPLRDVPLFSTFIPSKLFEFFAAGKAVIGAVTGEPARILLDGGAVVVGPEQPHALAAAIRELAADPERRTAMGVRGRRFVEEHFDRRQLAGTYRQLLHRVVATG
jgi:glycosyltransferase involved in cell wall biosynthesis